MKAYYCNHLSIGDLNQSYFNKIDISLIENFLASKDKFLITFGYDGSGKNYTLYGNKNEDGLILDCLKKYFEHPMVQIEEKKVNKKYNLKKLSCENYT